MRKNTAKSIVILGISSAIGYLTSLFLTSYITEYIGIEAYGFVSMAKMFANWGGIITLALTSFVVRYITVSYHSGNVDEAKSYYVSSINAGIAMCAVLAVVFAVLVIRLEHVIKIPEELVFPVKLLFAAVFAAFAAATMVTPFSTGFYIRDRLDISGIIKAISYLFEIAVLVALFSLFRPSVWFAGLGSLAAAVIVLAGAYFSGRKLVPELKYERRLHSAAKVKTLLKNGTWNAVNHLGNILNSGLDLFVANAMLTGVQTGQIAVAKSIGAIFETLSGVVFQPMQPGLLRVYSGGVNDAFLTELKKSMKYCGFFGSIAFSGFASLGLLFCRLWLPGQDSQLLYLLTLLTVFVFIMDLFLQPIYYVNTLTAKNRIPCFVTLGGGVLNVLGMYFLIKYTDLGIFAVPLTTAVIMFSINIFFNPVYASRCLDIRRMYFYPLILRHLAASVVMCVSLMLLSILINPSGWLGLIVCVFLFTVAGAAIYLFFVFPSDERKEMLSKIKENK